MKSIKGWLTGGTLAAAMMMGSMVVKADPGVIYGGTDDGSDPCVVKTDDGVIYGKTDGVIYGKSSDGVIYGVAGAGVGYGLDGVIYGVAGVIYGDKDTCPTD